MVVAITYDLNKAGQNYSNLYDAIEKLGVANHALQNLWFLDSNYTLDSIYTELSKCLDKNDFIFISKVNYSTSQGYMPKGAWDWLKDRAN